MADTLASVMKVKITYYLDVVSSWCYWAEPAWAELKERYAKLPVEFSWKIALLDESGMSKSRAQADWFYRRSGTIVRSPFMLNSGWLTHSKEYLPPNCVTEAAKDFGVTDDRVRLRLMEAAMREGQKVGDWDVSVAVAAKAAGLDAAALLKKARSPKIEKQVRATTAEFHALQVTQRPTFVLEDNIGDRAVFSGLVKAAPMAAAIDAMLDDAAAYASHAAHFGNPPPN
jgi:predicted DsbA family dithiol-disulfide isomerase